MKAKLALLTLLIQLSIAMVSSPIEAKPSVSYDEALCGLSDHVRAAAASDTQRIALVRSLVYDNSVHAKLQDYSWDIPTVIQMLWESEQATEEELPVLACGPRALAMRAILDELGIDNRIVAVFTDVGPAFQSHTFLEVFNRDTRRWEIHDPDFDVQYVDEKGRLLETTDLLLRDLRRILPVSCRGLGWRQNGIEHLREHYFEAAVYFPRDRRTGPFLIVVNRDRFDLDKFFPVNGKTFREYVKKRYRGAPIVELGGGGPKVR